MWGRDDSHEREEGGKERWGQKAQRFPGQERASPWPLMATITLAPKTALQLPLSRAPLGIGQEHLAPPGPVKVMKHSMF